MAFADGIYALRVPEFLGPSLCVDAWPAIAAIARDLNDRGLRVLLAYHPDASQLADQGDDSRLPAGMSPLGLVSLSDELRLEARETQAAFIRLGVRPKIISGDSPMTVAALARQAGLPADAQLVSGMELAEMDEAAFASAAADTMIFGRITPQQKERLVRRVPARAARGLAAVAALGRHPHNGAGGMGPDRPSTEGTAVSLCSLAGIGHQRDRPAAVLRRHRSADCPTEWHAAGQSMDRPTWLWLLIGALLLPFTALVPSFAFAAWLAPVFLLRLNTVGAGRHPGYRAGPGDRPHSHQPQAGESTESCGGARAFLGLLALIGVLALTGAIYQAIATARDRRAYPPGTLVRPQT